LTQKHVAGAVELLGGILTTTDGAVATLRRKAAAEPANGIGAEIPLAELLQYAPKLSAVVAAFSACRSCPVWQR
jgi:hypothetical protein